MVNYQFGKIYKIVDNTSDLIYIGSTCEPLLSRRLAKHKIDYKKYLNNKFQFITSFNVLKNNNFDIVLLENCPCNNKMELHARERFYIENNQCVNKNIPLRTDKEYYQDNKENINEKNKLWIKNNKERFSQLVKKNYEENIEKYKETKSIWYNNNKEDILEKERAIYHEKVSSDKGIEYKLQKQEYRKNLTQEQKDTRNARRRELRKLKKESQI